MSKIVSFVREAREQRKCCCEHCETISNKDKRALSVHHKDKDYTNNALNNLITLCNKCHKLLHNKLEGKLFDKGKLKTKKHIERRLKALLLLSTDFNNPHLKVDGRIYQIPRRFKKCLTE